MNKKGNSVFNMIFFVFIAFFALLMFGIIYIVMNQINDGLDQNVQIGQVNMQDVNSYTFGKAATGFANSADNFALAVIFGMILGMMANVYFFGDSNKIWIPIDIMVCIGVFILSVYMSKNYELIINSGSVISTLSTGFPKASALMLNLPLITGSLGPILMIICYAGIKRKDQGGAYSVNEYNQ